METERELSQRFGRNVRNARAVRKWTQETFAERAGISFEYVGMLERGERLPSLDMLIRVAQALGTSVADLLGKPDAEAWEEEVLTLLRSMSTGSREMVVTMIRAAAGAPGSAPAAPAPAAAPPAPPPTEARSSGRAGKRRR